MGRLTEQGHAVFANLTERGRLVVGALTDAARFVFGDVTTTYEKTGGAAADWEAGGRIIRRRKRGITLGSAQPQTQTRIIEVSGSARLVCEARGRRTAEKERTGGAEAKGIAQGGKVRTLSRRTGHATGRLTPSSLQVRIYAPRQGGAAFGADVKGMRWASHSERGAGRGALSGHGVPAILRGDDSEELILLGFEPEDEEMLVIA